MPYCEQRGLCYEACECYSVALLTEFGAVNKTRSPSLAHVHCNLAYSLCLPPSGNSTGQMGTTSAWPTQTAATAVSSSPTRKALSVSDVLWLHERQHALATGHYTSDLSLFSRSLHWLWHRAALLDQLRKQHHQPLQTGWLWTGGAWGGQGQADQGHCSGHHGYVSRKCSF